MFSFVQPYMVLMFGGHRPHGIIEIVS